MDGQPQQRTPLPKDRQTAFEFVVAIAAGHPLWTAAELAHHLSENYEAAASRAASLAGLARSYLEARLRAWSRLRRQGKRWRPPEPNPWTENAVKALEDG